MKFFLCGFSGAGKSSVLNGIDRGDFLRIDLDQYISAQKGQTISKIFEESGEDGFRQLEKKCLKDILGRKEPMLVALGGGSLENGNREMIRNAHAKLIYLDLPFENCWLRIQGDVNRPLVAKGKKYLQELYDARQTIYQSADYCLDALGELKNISRQVEDILLQDCQIG